MTTRRTFGEQCATVTRVHFHREEINVEIEQEPLCSPGLLSSNTGLSEER